MPTYEYACKACGHRLEAVQSFSDDPLTECPECGSALRKVYGAVGIVLKGSGFYKTDSRAANGHGSNGKKTEANSESSSTPKTESSSSDAGSGDSSAKKSDSPAKNDSSAKTDAKPAASAAT